MIKEAIEEAQCADSSGQESAEVCHAITMKTIPPCMLMEGTSEQAECLAEAAKDIEEELNTGDVEEVGTEVVANCKCDAFKKIHKALSSVREMMCAPSGSSTSCASRRVFLAWRAGSSPVAGTRQTLDSITSTIIFLVTMVGLGLMETFFLFWHSVVGSAEVLMVVVMLMLMVGMLMVVDMLCIAEK